MIGYIKGSILYKSKTYIILVVNNIGYKIYISNIDNYLINVDYEFYTYNIHKEDSNTLLGFNSMNQLLLCEELLKIKGIGPKSILNLFNKVSYEDIVDYISNDNIDILYDIKGINNTLVDKIINFINLNNNINDKEHIDLRNLLIKLGYKNVEINKCFKSVNLNNSMSFDKKLKLLLKGMDSYE